MKSLQHTSFKTMLQYTPEEIKYFLDLAAKLKADKKAGISRQKFCINF